MLTTFGIYLQYSCGIVLLQSYVLLAHRTLLKISSSSFYVVYDELLVPAMVETKNLYINCTLHKVGSYVLC